MIFAMETAESRNDPENDPLWAEAGTYPQIRLDIRGKLPSEVGPELATRLIAFFDAVTSPTEAYPNGVWGANMSGEKPRLWYLLIQGPDGDGVGATKFPVLKNIGDRLPLNIQPENLPIVGPYAVTTLAQQGIAIAEA